MSIEAIQAAIPHREPFLLVDEIVEQSDQRIVCRKTFSGEEFWYRGHYPAFPLTPGVLLVEAGMQAGAVLLAQHVKGSGTFSTETCSETTARTNEKVPDPVVGGVPVATRINNVKFRHMVRPGDTIEMQVELVERMADAFFLKAAVTVDGHTATTFDFACKMAAPKDQNN
jgi:3-hydroxyacyl-[acyl-carrier-protein] dehydratase